MSAIESGFSGGRRTANLAVGGAYIQETKLVRLEGSCCFAFATRLHYKKPGLRE
jgi:hypothetical protein